MSSGGYAQWSNELYRNGKMRQFAQESPRAYALWSFSIRYCSDQMTDGFVSVFAAKNFLSAKKREINELENSGLWEKTEGGWNVHDYLDWQNSSEKIARKRANQNKRQQEHRNNANVSADGVTQPVTRDTARDGDGGVTPVVTAVSRPQNQKPKTKQNNKESVEKNSSPSKDFDWRGEIEAWEPKPGHRQLANEQAGKGYALVDVHDLAQEFRLSVQGKANSYGYRDFDAAFKGWILKRSKDQKTDAKKHHTVDPEEVTRLADYLVQQIPEISLEDARGYAVDELKAYTLPVAMTLIVADARNDFGWQPA
jgi:hypothetical protein